MWRAKPSVSPAGLVPGAEIDQADWAQLNAQLLEAVMQHLRTKGNSSAALKDMLSVTGVCQHWRDVGSSLFFSGSNWRGQPDIRHPAQLVTLCPLGQAPGGLIRGQIRRQTCGWGLTGRRQRLLFYQSLLSATGQTILSGKFLLAAEQRSSGGWAVFMDRNCKGQPVAFLSCNALRTEYKLTAAMDGMGQGEGALGSSTAGRTLDRHGSSGLPSYDDFNSSTSPSSGSDALGAPRTLQKHYTFPGCVPSAPQLVRSGSLCSVLSRSSSLDSHVDVGQAEAAPAAAAAAAPTPDFQVLMSLQYKLHLRAMVLPRRMSVSLQVPSQQTQRALCSNSRSGQPTAAWHAQGAHSDAGGQQFPPLQQQNSSSSSTAASESGVIGSRGDAAAEADVAAARCLQKLESKQPHWNGALRVWCLNFNGRVKLSSAKNFQLVSAPPAQPAQPTAQTQPRPAAANIIDVLEAGNEVSSVVSIPGLRNSPGTGGIVVQFGKTEPNAFILDFDPCVITAMQAFAVALTTFGIKLLA